MNLNQVNLHHGAPFCTLTRLNFFPLFGQHMAVLRILCENNRTCSNFIAITSNYRTSLKETILNSEVALWV